jgi:hypothetical protein
MATKQRVSVEDGMETKFPQVESHACCYADCPEPGTIHIGMNGNPDTHWICWIHYYKWNANRARFLADGSGCEMQELGELVCREGCD